MKTYLKNKHGISHVVQKLTFLLSFLVIIFSGQNIIAIEAMAKDYRIIIKGKAQKRAGQGYSASAPIYYVLAKNISTEKK